jgi:hypothetical protein
MDLTLEQQHGHRFMMIARESSIMLFLLLLLLLHLLEVIQNHVNENVRNIGQGEARLKLGGGQAYDRSSD